VAASSIADSVPLGDPDLEIGCGTAQLTRQLVAHGVAVTAIDIGPSMIEVARRRVDSSVAQYVRTAFEDVDGPDPTSSRCSGSSRRRIRAPGGRVRARMAPAYRFCATAISRVPSSEVCSMSKSP
jgi:SAM-dependent methyltransferase